MELHLSDELRLVQQTVRSFVTSELIPLERSYGDSPLPDAERTRLAQTIRSMGLAAPATPAEDGGAGLDAIGLGIVLEELGGTILDGCLGGADLAGGDLPLPLWDAPRATRSALAAPVLARDCRIAARPPRAEEAAFAALVRDAGRLVVTGTVPGVEGWERAHAMLVLAAAPEGPTLVVLDRDAAGVSLHAEPDRDGSIGRRAAVVRLDGAEVSADRIVGGAGGALPLVARWSEFESLKTCARLVGLVSRAAAAAREYAAQRVTFGQPLSTRQAIQWKLVDTEMDLVASRWLVRRGLAEHEAGRHNAAAATQAAMFVLPAMWRGIDEMLQIFGGVGFTRDVPVEAMWRHIRAQQDRLGTRASAQEQVFAALAAGPQD